MKNLFYYETIIGKIGIAECEGKITNVFFGEDKLPKNEYEIRETEVLLQAAQQIREYFIGQRKVFDLPLAPAGTEFMLRVWNALREIPYGETRSYGEIAQNTGNKKASRAVGLANNRNPIPIIIPCHRVIGKNGKLVGYRGGLEVKEQLLKLEKITRA